jgi:hypothetical protein
MMRILAATALAATGLAGCDGGNEHEPAKALVEFARQPSDETWSRVPFADEVRLGLGRDLVLRRSARALRQREAWEIDVELFRAGTGPFTAFEELADPREDLAYDEGPYRRCVSPPAPAPREVAHLRRLSIRPREWESCLQWFAVDVFVDDGKIVAGALDYFEP